MRAYSHYTVFQVTPFLCFLSFVKAPLPQELGGTLKGFIVKYREQESAVSGFTEATLPATARQYTLENLKVFTLYGIKVAAVNEKGPGPYTPVYNVTTGERRKLVPVEPVLSGTVCQSPKNLTIFCLMSNRF